MPRGLSILRAVALVFALALASLAPAAGQDAAPLNLDSARATLAEIDSALKGHNFTDGDLKRLQAENDPLGPQLLAVIADLTPRMEASNKRLAELTPKPRDTPGAIPSAPSEELTAERAKHDALDASLRTARALKLQVDDNAARIGAARRDLFARETLARSSSLINPELWISLWRESASDVRSLGALFGGWTGDLGARLTLAKGLGFLAVAVLLALLVAPVRWIARRVIFRDPAAETPTRLRRALAAVWTFLVLTILPLLALLALVLALDWFDISDPRMQGVLDALLDGARLLILVNALGRGVLAPGLAAWRMFELSDRVAGQMFRGAMTIASIWAVERLVEPIADAAGSLAIAVAGRAVGSTLIAIALGRALRRIAGPLPIEGGAAIGSDAWAPARTLAWAAAILILAATLTGYIALATFIINQSLFLTMLVAALYLGDVIVQDGAETLLQPEAPIGARLLIMVGLRRNTLSQIVVLAQGLARLAVIIAAAIFVLEPWGVQSQDMLGSLRTAYFGFTVGGLTVSLSSMLAATVVFIIAVVATRIGQNWLGARFLPQTRLDAGVSNSIRTIFGYVGVVVAILLSGSQLGLDVQKFVIVAGALSVGIGFGLQPIVNNFVSGLILLWERGIRVGDWIVVGTEQGFVRRINARATEIETFDRGTLIVPNSTLVGGVVKNWVHSDRVGRVLIALNVAYDSDVEAVRELLIAAAKAHELALAIPAPTVLFTEFGDFALKFQLICFVDDVETAPRVASDLNFDILRRLREANVRQPYPYPTPAPQPPA